MGRPKLKREEKLERKKNAERERRSKIKKDVSRYEELKAKYRETRNKRKREGKIQIISEMTPSQRNKVRERNKMYAQKYRNKKKNLKKKKSPNPNEPSTSRDVSEHLIADDSVPIENANNVLATPPHLSQRVIETRNSKTTSSPNPTNEPSTSRILLEQQEITTRRLRSKRCTASSSDTATTSKSVQPDHDAQSSLAPKSPSCTSITDTSSVVSSASSVAYISSAESSYAHTPKSSKLSLRKLRYQNEKQFMMLHKRIQELTNINCKYRKQVSRMKQSMKLMRPNSTRDSDTTDSSIQSCDTEERNTNTERAIIIKKQLENDVKSFYLDDENSRICPGKKEFVTVKKEKRQKRYLTDTIINLHKQFILKYPHQKISYSHFCSLRPFWVKVPDLKARDTCLCKQHENMELIVSSLKRNRIITEKNSKDVLSSVCCNAYDVQCLTRTCNICKNKAVVYQEFDNSNTISYYKWTTEKKDYVKNGQLKTTNKNIKASFSAVPKDVIKEFEKGLLPYMTHSSIIISQNAHIRKLKENLSETEAIIHADFSENYLTKYGDEIQAVHFGGSRQQITLHTVVIYLKKNNHLLPTSFCTLSASLRHDAAAIWEHLIPVLNYIKENAPSVDTLPILTDSPSAQYRNRKMFYIVSKLHWYYTGLRCVSWNYSESGHGKGAPDGVGAVLKRTADKIVSQGKDIPDMKSLMAHLKTNVQGVIIQEVYESGIYEKDLLMPHDLPNFKGTMKVHQAMWHASKKNVLSLRKLSCDRDDCATSSIQCFHGQHVGIYRIEEEGDSQNNFHDDPGNIPPDDTFWVRVPTPIVSLNSSTIQNVIDNMNFDSDENIF